MTLYEEARYPMSRSGSYLRALNLYNNNPKNFVEETKEPVI